MPERYEGLPGAPGRSSLFAPGSAASFADGCGEGGALGLCLPAAPDAPALWLSTDLDGADAGSRAVPYGQFTGAVMQTGQGFLPSRRPRYLIELLPFHPPGAQATAAAGGLATESYVYRITAIGFGAGKHASRAASYYRKPGGGTAMRAPLARLVLLVGLVCLACGAAVAAPLPWCWRGPTRVCTAPGAAESAAQPVPHAAPPRARMGAIMRRSANTQVLPCAHVLQLSVPQQGRGHAAGLARTTVTSPC